MKLMRLKTGGAVRWAGFGLLGGGLAAAVYYAFWKQADMEAEVTAREITDVDAFAAALPREAKPYASIFAQVGSETGVDPFLLAAIAMRESRCGAALTPPGPGGTGDFAPRTWGPSTMPPDGLGWGRGIMQVDYNAFAGWLGVSDWASPYVNIKKGAEVLKGKIKFFQGNSKVPGTTDGTTVIIGPTSAIKRGVSAGNYPDPRPLAGDALIRAAVAAYNTGEGNVLMSLAAGKDADTTTARGGFIALAGGDYASSVLSSAADYSAGVA